MQAKRDTALAIVASQGPLGPTCPVSGHMTVRQHELMRSLGALDITKYAFCVPLVVRARGLRV